MRLTIIRDDNSVGVNGEFREIDLSSLDADLRALQWNGVAGHIEHYSTPTNTAITNIDNFANIVFLWQTQVTPPIKPLNPAQIRLVLLNNGLLEQVESMIAQSTDAVKIEWEFRTEYRRTNPLLLQMAAALGLTDEQLDTMFEEGLAL